MIKVKCIQKHGQDHGRWFEALLCIQEVGLDHIDGLRLACAAINNEQEIIRIIYHF